MPILGHDGPGGKAGPTYRATNGSGPGHDPVSDDRAGDDAPHLGPDLIDRAIRLAELGYVPIPSTGKRPFTGWNAVDYAKHQILPSGKGSTVEKIQRWPKRYALATTISVRVQDRLGVIDLDINDQAMVERMIVALNRIAPGLADAPMRFSSGTHKAAIFYRVEGELFNRIGTHKYQRPGDPPDVYHQIEFFGGKRTGLDKCSRFFGLYGARKFTDDGLDDRGERIASGIGSIYEWADGPRLDDVALADLPALTRETKS
jgi:hypothetical protein